MDRAGIRVLSVRIIEYLGEKAVDTVSKLGNTSYRRELRIES